jgi:hypothetical protein
MKEAQINLQSALNPENRSHMQLWKWLNEQTTNRSSFIRETLFMRMMGMIGVRVDTSLEFEKQKEEIDADEVMRLIQV